jgi:hypothetical protein
MTHCGALRCTTAMPHRAPTACCMITQIAVHHTTLSCTTGHSDTNNCEVPLLPTLHCRTRAVVDRLGLADMDSRPLRVQSICALSGYAVCHRCQRCHACGDVSHLHNAFTTPPTEILTPTPAPMFRNGCVQVSVTHATFFFHPLDLDPGLSLVGHWFCAAPVTLPATTA